MVEFDDALMHQPPTATLFVSSQARVRALTLDALSSHGAERERISGILTIGGVIDPKFRPMMWAMAYDGRCKASDLARASIYCGKPDDWYRRNSLLTLAFEVGESAWRDEPAIREQFGGNRDQFIAYAVAAGTVSTHK